MNHNYEFHDILHAPHVTPGVKTYALHVSQVCKGWIHRTHLVHVTALIYPFRALKRKWHVRR